MTVRSTLLTVATAAAALLGAAACQAAPAADYYPAGEGEVIQRAQPVRSTLTRAQVTAQVEAAQRSHTLAAATCDAIRSKGGKVVREAGPMKHGTTVIAFIEDPDGYKVELIEKRKPAT